MHVYKICRKKENKWLENTQNNQYQIYFIKMKQSWNDQVGYRYLERVSSGESLVEYQICALVKYCRSFWVVSNISYLSTDVYYVTNNKTGIYSPIN